VKDDFNKLRILTDRLPFIGHQMAEIPVKVLVVEDEKSINRLILDTLEYFGCICESARNKEEAVDKIKKSSFDVLITNIMLKNNKDGPEIIRIYQEENKNGVAIIMSDEEKNLSTYSKYFATLAMPFGIYELIKKIKVGLEEEKK
jgi:DNA-binding response OmpR family regulator